MGSLRTMVTSAFGSENFRTNAEGQWPRLTELSEVRSERRVDPALCVWVGRDEGTEVLPLVTAIEDELGIVAIHYAHAAAPQHDVEQLFNRFPEVSTVAASAQRRRAAECKRYR